MYLSMCGHVCVACDQKQEITNCAEFVQGTKVAKAADDAASCVAVFCDRLDDLTRDGPTRDAGVNMHPNAVLIGHFSCDTCWC